MDQATSTALNNLRDFLEKNMLSKQQAEERFEILPTKDDVLEVMQDVLSLKSEVATLRIDVSEMKTTLTELNQRDIQDSNAFAKDIVQLQKDVNALKLKHAS